MRKFSEMPMPARKKPASEVEVDIFGEGEPVVSKEDEEAPEEFDTEEKPSALADISDEDILAEIKKRGLSIEPSKDEEIA